MFLITESIFRRRTRERETTMASLQVLKSSLSPFLGFQSRKSSCFFCSVSDITSSKKRLCKLRSRRRLSFRVCCRVREGDNNESNGEEPPESLFMKELKKRGMTPTSLLEDNNKSSFGRDEEVNLKGDGRGFTKRKAVSTDFEIGEGLANQRERSMALNSEGLEGLIPRAKLLLTLGGTFFLGFWPLILVNVVIFIALYLYFGTTFIHDGTDPAMSAPPYIDPYILLEEERLQKLSQAAPQVN